MTIKNILSNVCFVGTVVLAVLSSCAGDDAMGEGYLSNRDMLSNPTTLEMAGNVTETTFELKANGKWEASDLPNWLTLDPSSGIGSATIKVKTTGENPSSADSREATFIIKSDNKENKITFTQKASPFAMEVSIGDETGTLSFTKDDEGVKRIFTVTSNCNWQLDNDAATYNKWFDVSPTSGGIGSTTVTVTNKMKNDTEIPNNVELVVSPDQTVPNAKAQTVHVEQKGIETSFALNTDKMTVTPVGGTSVFRIEDRQDNSTWEARIYTDIAGWITMTKDGVTGEAIEGRGQAEIQVTCTPTNQQGRREARIVVTKKYDSTFEKTMTVEQSGANSPEISASNIIITPHKHGATVAFMPVSELPVSDCHIKYYKRTDGESTAKTLACTTSGDGYYTVEITDLLSMTDYMVCFSAKNNVGTTTTSYQMFTTTGGVPGEDDTPIPGLSNKRK